MKNFQVTDMDEIEIYEDHKRDSLKGLCNLRTGLRPKYCTAEQDKEKQI